LKFVAKACDAENISGTPETNIGNVCTDSRAAKAGDVFFAIKGEKFDGHEFVGEVCAKAVAAVVVEKYKVPGLRSKVPVATGLLAVEDVRIALGRLATEYRREFAIPVIAVGGSNGKTTTKELVASVLRQKFTTLWS